MYILNWLATLILPFAKTTFFIFYLQLFRPFRWLRILCYIGISFTTITFLSFLVAQLALVTPHPGETWLQVDEDPRELKSLKYLSIPITATSFGIDIYIFIIPMLGIAKLKLSPRRKLGVVLVFLTGSTFDPLDDPVLSPSKLMFFDRACIASLLTLIYKIQLNGDSRDVTWNSMPVNITMLVQSCPFAL